MGILAFDQFGWSTDARSWLIKKNSAFEETKKLKWPIFKKKNYLGNFSFPGRNFEISLRPRFQFSYLRFLAKKRTRREFRTGSEIAGKKIATRPPVSAARDALTLQRALATPHYKMNEKILWWLLFFSRSWKERGSDVKWE